MPNTKPFLTKPEYSESTLNKAKAIKLLICDVDGVLSDGKVYYSNQGDEIKSFNIKDGLGIKNLMKNGVQVAIITGRQSSIVERRAKELGISLIYQGKVDKKSAYDEIMEKLGIKENQVAHIGDDLPDLPLIQRSGLGVCVADGHYFVRSNSDWVTDNKGGQGSVREVADLILTAQNKLKQLHQQYLNP